MGAVAAKGETLGSLSITETKLEAKMVEAMQRRAAKGSHMKSFNTIILKFPKIDENLRNCKDIFEQFDEDSNGTIDHDEMKRAFSKLEVSFTDEEIDDLFAACDINEDMGINFNEFIVLICVVFLLKDDHNTGQKKVDMGMPKLEATFETLVDAFVFLDKNKDGYVSKSEMVQSINETTTGERSSLRIAMKRFGERSSLRIAMKRFEEMDWDHNGMVNFKEFLFAFTRWIGIDDDEDED